MAQKGVRNNKMKATRIFWIDLEMTGTSRFTPVRSGKVKNQRPSMVDSRHCQNSPKHGKSVELQPLALIERMFMIRICLIAPNNAGLDPDKDTIMEAACVITESDLSEVARIEKLVVHHPSYVLNAMNEWCKVTHGKSGLTTACLQSTKSIKQAEEQILEFLQEHTNPNDVPLAGNSVHMDKMFIRKYFPRVYDHLHYRIIDISSIGELCRRWNPSVYNKQPLKAKTHRAFDDIIESINELRYYREHFLVS